MIKNLIYIFKFICLISFLKKKYIIKFDFLILLTYIKLLINLINFKLKNSLYKNFNKNLTKTFYYKRNYCIKYYILKIKFHSKTTKKSKIFSYKSYILSKFDKYFGLGKNNSINILDSIKKSKYNSNLNLVNLNLLELKLKKLNFIKFKNCSCFISYNFKNYKIIKNYFNIILILLNLNNYNIKVYNNNIDNIFKLIFLNFK